MTPSNHTHQPLRELMEHIIEKHHAFCRREITRLSVLFKDTVMAHGADRPELKRMQALCAAMARDLQMHLVKEEETLFPYIARVEEDVLRNAAADWPRFGTVGNPIRMMILEHEQTGGELAEIRRLSNGYALPAGAPELLVRLYDSLREFERDMKEHVHAEDEVLFPRAIAIEEQACGRRNGV